MGGQHPPRPGGAGKLSVLVFDPLPVRALEIELLVRRVLGDGDDLFVTSSLSDAAEALGDRVFSISLLDTAAASSAFVSDAVRANPAMVVAWMTPARGPPTSFGERLVRPIVLGDIAALTERVP